MPRLGDRTGPYRVALHDRSRAIISELVCGETNSLSYARTLSEVSQASLTGTTASTYEAVADVIPWAHWMSVWRGEEEYVWAGPAPRLSVRRSSWVLSARDHGSLLWKTRAQYTKRYADTDPAVILAELWDSMTSFHGISGLTGSATVVPTALSYGFEINRDRRMVSQIVEDLVKMGVEWTVYAGKPVLIPALRTDSLVFKQYALADCDFAEELEVVLDGSTYVNDARVQGANYAETVVVPAEGLRMQDLISIDSLKGADNIRRAARQIAARRSTLRRAVSVPTGATLSPDVEVTVNDLMPGIVVPISTDIAGGVTELQRLEAVEVTVDAGGERVAVTFGASATEVANTETEGVVEA